MWNKYSKKTLSFTNGCCWLSGKSRTWTASEEMRNNSVKLAGSFGDLNYWIE
jgi:hypothetical protein